MKQFTFLAASLFFFGALNAQQVVTPTLEPNKVQEVKDIRKILTFSETTHSFGKIPQGKPVEFDVEIKNISTDSVKVENVQVQCGCTTPKWQPGPYAPGQSFKITLGFNAAAVGPFNKSVTVYFAGGLQQVISFNGEVFQVAENAAPANNGIDKLKPGSKN